MKSLFLCFYVLFFHYLSAGEINKNKLGKTSSKMIKHVYIEELAKSIFSKETKINDFLNVQCTPDDKLDIWICYIRQYVKFYDGNNYIKVDINNNKWHLIIDFINEKYTVKKNWE